MNPEPICKPMVNTQLHRMNALQRATESFRYVLLSIEHWISPDGGVRQWIKANTRLAVFMAAPTLMVFPVITMTLWEFEAWISSLTTIVSKLIVLPVLALVSIVIVSCILRVLRP